MRRQNKWQSGHRRRPRWRCSQPGHSYTVRSRVGRWVPPARLRRAAWPGRRLGGSRRCGTSPPRGGERGAAPRAVDHPTMRNAIVTNGGVMPADSRWRSRRATRRARRSRPARTPRGLTLASWPCNRSWLYQRKNARQWSRAASIEPKRAGKSGRYFSVLNWASEYGLSFETCGRECDWQARLTRGLSHTGAAAGGVPVSCIRVATRTPEAAVRTATVQMAVGMP